MRVWLATGERHGKDMRTGFAQHAALNEEGLVVAVSNGGSTQLKGVTPDIIIPSYLDVMGLGEDSLEHALPWDIIRPAMYRYDTDRKLNKLIPVLSAQSTKRINTNDDFQVFLAKRDRLKKRYETKTVSLSLANRIEEAEAEKELDEIQSGSFLDEDESEDFKDIVLDETLLILSDIIDQKKRPAVEQQPAPVLSVNE